MKTQAPRAVKDAAELKPGDVLDDFLVVLEVRETHRTTGPSIVAECRGAQGCVATRIWRRDEKVRFIDIETAE